MKSIQVIKTALICLFFACTTHHLSAQDLPFSMTVNAGVDISDMHIEDLSTRLKVNHNVNITFEYNLSKSFFLQTGMEFAAKGAKINDNKSRLIMGEELLESIIDWEIKPTDEYFCASKTIGKITNRYLTLPVMGGYRLNLSDKFRINFALGLYFSQGIGGKTKTDQLFVYKKMNSIDYNHLSPDPYGPQVILSHQEGNSFDMFNRFDMGLRGNAGVEYRRFLLTIGYEYGLVDQYKGNEFSSRNMNLIATLGFRIF